ncbi:CDP-alcohol phosphatidyltransferase family protein [Leptospira ryugenii]|uniref:CDP-alcohol phosphatidyltransferase family protein n=1 Tax=Leptospira ryugenii TaxID=1917863 RepID=UPI000D59A64F|nr:CDP-alcohol phosphatidyltransferase family protein [Leptospira ryugenii]
MTTYSVILQTIFSPPNLLTLLRILFIPLTLYFFEARSWSFAFPLLFFILLTDALDGWIARKWNLISTFGSILDPIADKLVVLGFFLYLTGKGLVPFYYVILICLRDLSQLSVVPVLVLWKKISFQVKPKFIPKLGTALNFVILAYYLLCYSSTEIDFLDPYLVGFGYVILPILILSSCIEMYILLTFWPRYRLIFLGKHDTFE